VNRLTDEQLEHIRNVARVYRDMVSDRGDSSGNAILIDVATGVGHHRLYLDDLAALIAEVDALRAERAAVVCVAVRHGNSTISSIMDLEA
jgi:hypothetical protein